jgi:hypothetical protein
MAESKAKDQMVQTTIGTGRTPVVSCPYGTRATYRFAIRSGESERGVLFYRDDDEDSDPLFKSPFKEGNLDIGVDSTLFATSLGDKESYMYFQLIQAFDQRK